MEHDPRTLGSPLFPAGVGDPKKNGIEVVDSVFLGPTVSQFGI
jgi:hypothetical protein